MTLLTNAELDAMRAGSEQITCLLVELIAWRKAGRETLRCLSALAHYEQAVGEPDESDFTLGLRTRVAALLPPDPKAEEQKP